jgi:hypothetical protein
MEVNMDEEDLIPAINGVRVANRLLDLQPLRRCDIVRCHGACCAHGVWLDAQDRDTILRHAHLVKPYLRADRRDEQAWFMGYARPDADFPTGLCDGTVTLPSAHAPCGEACVFQLADARCALQVAAVENGLPRWLLKPFFCAIFPLVVHGGELQLDEENELYQQQSCSQNSGQGQEPPYLAMKDEFVRALGSEGYERLCHLAAARQLALPRGRRARL